MTDLDVRRVTESDVQLLVPEHDEPDPEVSIVIPALNEELTIEDFVAWCHQGLADAGVRGEVLIVDSSSDATSELALAGVPGCCAPRSGVWGVPTSMPCPTSGAAT